ncbi:hypothetical protein AB4Z50_27870 [Paenibacillus sp. 2TAB26]
MYSLSEDFQYHDSYFIVGNPWFPIIIVGILIIAGVIIYKLLRKKQ